VVCRLLFSTHTQTELRTKASSLEKRERERERERERMCTKTVDTSIFSDVQMSNVKSENELQLAAFELNKVVKMC
jgi:hypothetical protein